MTAPWVVAIIGVEPVPAAFDESVRHTIRSCGSRWPLLE